jgi:glycosyltransferase involved in cell wall biosynthesis
VDLETTSPLQIEPLQIAMVSTPWFEVPPKGYGGIESVCHVLAEGLTSRGHDVALIGAGTDHDSAGFIPTFTEPADGLGTGESVTVEGIHALRATRYISDMERVDVVHDHSVLGPALADRHGAPTVVTAHGPIEGTVGDLFRLFPRNVAPVAISDSQRSAAPDVPWVSTIHHGIDVEEIPFREDKEDFLLFLGRMDPTKGPHVAIDAAREAGSRLVMAAKCSDPHEKAFFEETVEPRLGPDVEWLGEADEDTKRELLARARALLFPIDWEEPFGLVMIEAMAAGTPVLAFRRGSVPEVVVDEITGVIVDRPEELVEAIERVDSLDPNACREHVRRRFSLETMIDRYESLFSDLARRGATKEPLPAA